MNWNRFMNVRVRGLSLLPLVFIAACFAAGGLLFASAVASPKAAKAILPRYVTKNIEDIKVGDWVLAKNPNEVGLPTPHRVLELPRSWSEHVVHIRVQGGGELQATRTHPFWVDGVGWMDAKDLHPGSRLQNDKGANVIVEGVRIEDRTTDTFNLIVEGVHTYYVMAGGVPILVHNGYGSYTLTFNNGMQYIGKGDFARAAQSAEEKASEYGSPLAPNGINWSDAANNEDSFLQEEFRMRAAGGPGGATYNEINSPGNKLAQKYGCP